MRQCIRYNKAMKIDQNLAIIHKITLLDRVKSFNIAMSHQMIDFIFSHPPFIKKTNLYKVMKNDGLLNIDAYQSLLSAKFLKDPTLKKYPGLLDLSLRPNIHHLNPAPFIGNPFYKRIKPRPVSEGKWQLGYETYLPFQGVLNGDVTTSPIHHYLEMTPLGFFEEPFYYLVIKQQGTTWMSVTPFEINTMSPVIDKMSGRVVTLGLGLGYFASMAALKPLVNEVLVVEKDKQVIELFLKHIHPHLENKEKIKIHHEDAYDYLRQNTQPFDHIFVDIHHTADDGLPIYIRMKKLEKESQSGQWHYWLESSILALFRRYMIVFLQEQLLLFDERKYQNPTTLEDYLYQGLYQANQKTSINSLTELNHWLSNVSIQSILTAIDLPDEIKESR
jgi:hypothetical protein